MLTLTTPALDFEQLVHAHVGPLWRYLRLIGCEPARADDLAQEALFALWRKQLFDLDPPATQVWLRKAARYLYLDTVRADARRRETELADAADAVTALNERGDEPYSDRLNRCLDKLAGRARQALDLRYRQAKNTIDAATKLGLTEDGLKTLLKRAKTALRECLEHNS